MVPLLAQAWSLLWRRGVGTPTTVLK